MKHSVYITWAKRHAAARYNLANSGVLPCDVGDLPVTLDDVALNGPGHDGSEPLGEAIASHFGTSAGRVVTAQGTSMANFLAFATVLERGDEVLVEQPTYEPFLAARSRRGSARSASRHRVWRAGRPSRRAGCRCWRGCSGRRRGAWPR
jgi:hypothetical protein